MTIRVYNTKQQSLNAEKVAELFSFSSNDFGGLISSIENPIVFDNTNNVKSWNWSEQIQGTEARFLAGGINIAYDVPSNQYPDENDVYPKEFDTAYSGYPCCVWGLDVVVPSNDSSIVTDNYTKAKLKPIYCKTIDVDNIYIVIDNPSGDPSSKEYYEYDDQTGTYILSNDDTVVEGKIYYYVIEDQVFKINNIIPNSFNEYSPEDFKFDFNIEYYGNTPWVKNDRFFIPFCGMDQDGNLISMIFNRDRAGYESFLSARTYWYLLNELSNKFVFRVGGPQKGDIGSLNVTDDLISNKSSGGHVKLQSPSVTNVSPVYSSDYMFAVLYNTEGTNNVSAHVGITPPDYTIPVMRGGTQADNTATARRNLGFLYGTSEPSGNPQILGMAGSIAQGSIYFKIL